METDENLNQTDEFEVLGIFNNIIPNICVINSICAGYAIEMLFNPVPHDFIYYDGSGIPFVRKVTFGSHRQCFLCNGMCH